LFPVPQNDQLRSELQPLSDEVLIQKLAAFKSLHNHTDTCERERLVRALEIEVYYHDHPELQDAARPRASIIFGLCGDRNVVRQKITKRLKERLDNGLIEEVDNLLKSGVNPAQLIRYGLEYKFVTLFLQKLIDKETLFRQLNTAIHQFSKRQMTWFRRMERSGFVIHWIDCALPMEKKTNMLISALNEAQ
jgi:tRNA dimethylallyltransferase